MNRTTRTIVVVGIAVLVAAVASLGAYQAIKRMPVREVEVHSVYYVVAAHDMTMGSRITKDYVKLVAWPASSPVPKGFTSIEAVLNRGLIDSVVENEPLTESKLAPLEAGAGLPPSIPKACAPSPSRSMKSSASPASWYLERTWTSSSRSGVKTNATACRGSS